MQHSNGENYNVSGNDDSTKMQWNLRYWFRKRGMQTQRGHWN